MGLANAGGGEIDENGIEKRIGDTFAYEMRAVSHKSRHVIVRRLSAIINPLYILFIPLSFVPFLEPTRDNPPLSDLSLNATPTNQQS